MGERGRKRRKRGEKVTVSGGRNCVRRRGKHRGEEKEEREK